KLRPAIIRERLDYWTLILGPKFSNKERKRINLSRFFADRILPQLHLQEEFPHPQALRAQLRAGAVAAHTPQDLRDLRPTTTPQDLRQARHRHRPDRARPSCLSRLLQARVLKAVREVFDVPAQRTLLQ